MKSYKHVCVCLLVLFVVVYVNLWQRADPIIFKCIDLTMYIYLYLTMYIYLGPITFTAGNKRDNVDNKRNTSRKRHAFVF